MIGKFYLESERLERVYVYKGNEHDDVPAIRKGDAFRDNAGTWIVDDVTTNVFRDGTVVIRVVCSWVK